MKRVLVVFMTLVFVQVCLSTAAAQDKGAECQTLVEKCLTSFKEKGKEATLQLIKDPKGPFVKDDLYIFALTMDNVMVGHPHNKSLRGMNMNTVKDSKGNHFFVKFKEVVEKDGSGWVEYMWQKPGDSDSSPKKSFIKRVPEEDLYIGAGYYLR